MANNTTRKIMIFLLIILVGALVYQWRGNIIKEGELNNIRVTNQNTSIIHLQESIKTAEKNDYKNWSDIAAWAEHVYINTTWSDRYSLGDYETIAKVFMAVETNFKPSKTDREFLHKFANMNFNVSTGSSAKDNYIKFIEKNDKKLVEDYVQKTED